MPSTSAVPKTKEAMYCFMLAHELQPEHKSFLTRSIFANQEAFLSSVDLTNSPHLITKTDVNANDKDFLHSFTDLLLKTQNLKIDQEVLDNMIQSLYRTATSTKSSSARHKVQFVLALLDERKFFINLIRSLLRIVNYATTSLQGGKSDQSGQPLQVPRFQNDPFLEDEFQKLTTQVRSQSSLNAPAKKYPIHRLLQSSASVSNQVEQATPGGHSSSRLLGGGNGAKKNASSDLLLTEGNGDEFTAFSATPNKQHDVINKSPLKTMFDSFQPAKNRVAPSSGYLDQDLVHGNAHKRKYTVQSDNEYQPDGTRLISDNSLGLNHTASASHTRAPYRTNHFSFAETLQASGTGGPTGATKVATKGVYMTEGGFNASTSHHRFGPSTSGPVDPNSMLYQQQHQHARSDMASNSPSFGHASSKSPLSHQQFGQPSRQAAIRQSRKNTTTNNNVLREYNQLFKRIETVQLKHKWETDDEDGAADVTSTSSEGDIGAAVGVDTGQSAVGEDDYEAHKVLNTQPDALSKDKSLSIHKKTASRKGQVQKPDRGNVILGKRAIVRTSDKRLSKGPPSVHLQTTDSRSPQKQNQSVKSGSVQIADQKQLLFSQNKKQKSLANASSLPPHSQGTAAQGGQPSMGPLQPHAKVPSRNSKRSDLYTKSVPSLTAEQVKQSVKEISQTTSNDGVARRGGAGGDNKTKLLKEASIALAMTLSPKSQHQKIASQTSVQNGSGSGHMAMTQGSKQYQNPQITSQSKFERTYQSLGSHKGGNAIGVKNQRNRKGSRSTSSNHSKDKSDKKQSAIARHQRRPTAGPQTSQHHPSQSDLHQQKPRKSSSPYRYTDTEYRESLCEESHDLVLQLREEQKLEYASHTSSQNKQGTQAQVGVLLPTENGAISSIEASLVKRGGSSGSDKASGHASLNLNFQKQETSGQDEYELNLQQRSRRPTVNSVSSKKLQMRAMGGSSTSKHSQSKLLGTATLANVKSNNAGAVIEGPTQPKKLDRDAKLLFPRHTGSKKQRQFNDSRLSKQNSLPLGLSTTSSGAARRNSEYKDHQIYQIKTMKDQKAQLQQSSQGKAEPNGTVSMGGQAQTRFTSDAGSYQKRNEASVDNDLVSKPNMMQQPQAAIGASQHKKVNSQRTPWGAPDRAVLQYQGTAASANTSSKYVSKSGRRAAESADSGGNMSSTIGAQQRSAGYPKITTLQHKQLQQQKEASAQGSAKQPVLKKNESGSSRSPPARTLVKPDQQQTTPLTKRGADRQSKASAGRDSTAEKRGGKNSNHSIKTLKTTSSAGRKSQGQPGSALPIASQPAAASSTAYGGLRLNIHHDSSHASLSSSKQLNISQRKDLQQTGVAAGHGTSLHHSATKSKSSSAKANLESRSGASGKKRKAVGAALAATTAALAQAQSEVGSAAYLEDEEEGFGVHGRNAQALGSPSQNQATKVFDESLEDVRQQIVFVGESLGGASTHQVAIAQQIDEPQESERSCKEPNSLHRQHRNQVNALFGNDIKPKRQTVDRRQSLQDREDGTGLQELEEEDSDAMFGHLNRTETESQPETFDDNFSQKDRHVQLHNYTGEELSDKVSFNLENVSHIKHSDSRVHLHGTHSHTQGKKDAITLSNNTSAKHQQFSIHGSDSNQIQLTIRNTKPGHAMTAQQNVAVKKPLVNKGSTSAARDLEVQAQGSNSYGANLSLKKSTRNSHHLRSASIDDSQPKAGGSKASSIRASVPLQTSEAAPYRRNNETMRSQQSQDFFSEDSMANYTASVKNGATEQAQVVQEPAADADDQLLEDAERAHKLSQVRMELYRGQEIRNSRKSGFSNRHMSSSSSERSCSSVQFKQQLKSIHTGSQEQSPSAKQMMRLRKDRRKLFFGVDSSTERDNEEQEQEYGANNDSNAAQEYSIVNNPNKGSVKTQRALKAINVLKGGLSPAQTALKQTQASKKQSNQHYFGVKKTATAMNDRGGSDADNLSSSGAALSQEDLDDSYNKFLVKQRSRRL